jgi:hypothetical protein
MFMAIFGPREIGIAQCLSDFTDYSLLFCRRAFSALNKRVDFKWETATTIVIVVLFNCTCGGGEGRSVSAKAPRHGLKCPHAKSVQRSTWPFC